jgi:hypothetical protein
MNSIRRSSAALLAFVAVASAGAAPALTGILALAEGPRFCLVDDETETETPASQWLGLGDEFQGYTLARFDPKTEKLTLTRDKETLVLELRAAKIEALRPDTPELASGADASTALELRTLPNFELHQRGLHRIEKGDTLSTIARDTGLSIRQIMNANEGLSPVDLRVGRIIRLRASPRPPVEPAAEPAAQAPATAPATTP